MKIAQEVAILNWNEIIKEVQSTIRFAQTPKLKGRSPAEILPAYKPWKCF